MRRVLRLEDAGFPLDVDRPKDGGRGVAVRGEAIPGEAVARPSAGGWLVACGNRTVEVSVERNGRRVTATAGGESFAFDLGRRPNAAGGPGRTAGRAVRTPMPGRVVRILKNVGETVERGDGVVVYEAMKMQNRIRAPGAGVVATMNAESGASMEGGELLFEIEPVAGDQRP